MAFEFPLDKLSVINSALTATGDNTVNVADDGSDEWNVASPAYETALGYIIESHSWGYASLVKVLQPSPTAPADTDFDTAYPLPTDLVHLLWVKLNANQSNPSATISQMTTYDIQANPAGGPPLLLVNAQGGPPPPNPPVTPFICTIKYVSNSGALADSTSGTPIMVTALQRFVMAANYRGLHEDVAEAANEEKAARVILQEARTRYDQQKPKRAFFNSRMAASRRIRRPWPPIGTGSWGSGSGSGLPG